MSRVVAPGATQREVVDALNTVSSRVTGGEISLSSGTQTRLENPRIGPASTIFVAPIGGGPASAGQGDGAGYVTLTHAAGSGGQRYRYVVVNA